MGIITGIYKKIKHPIPKGCPAEGAKTVTNDLGKKYQKNDQKWPKTSPTRIATVLPQSLSPQPVLTKIWHFFQEFYDLPFRFCFFLFEYVPPPFPGLDKRCTDVLLGSKHLNGIAVDFLSKFPNQFPSIYNAFQQHCIVLMCQIIFKIHWSAKLEKKIT